MAKAKAKDEQPVEASAPEPALLYVGGGEFVHGIPDTNLSADELAAVAAKRGYEPSDLAAELVERGLYAAGPAMPAPAAKPEEGES